MKFHIKINKKEIKARKIIDSQDFVTKTHKDKKNYSRKEKHKNSFFIDETD